MFFVLTQSHCFVRHRRASLRPASTFDRSAPILTPQPLTFSSSQSSSTSTSPPDHTHFNFPGNLTLSDSTELRDLPNPDDTNPREADCSHVAPYYRPSKEEVFHDTVAKDGQTREPENEIQELRVPETNIQELQTISRQTIASLADVSVTEDKQESESDSDDGEGDSSSEPPSRLVGRSSLDAAPEFEVLAASGSSED